MKLHAGHGNVVMSTRWSDQGALTDHCGPGGFEATDLDVFQ